MTTSAQTVPQCPNRDLSSPTSDVTWLLHRSAQRLRAQLDVIAQDAGLTDLRDWIVLSAINDGRRRTQFAIGQELGLDKTTLTTLLDRLERDGFILRTVDPSDRRARLPQITEAGKNAQLTVAKGRDEVEERMLQPATTQERHAFLEVLQRLAGVGQDAAEPTHGSCM